MAALAYSKDFGVSEMKNGSMAGVGVGDAESVCSDLDKTQVVPYQLRYHCVICAISLLWSLTIACCIARSC